MICIVCLHKGSSDFKFIEATCNLAVCITTHEPLHDIALKTGARFWLWRRILFVYCERVPNVSFRQLGSRQPCFEGLGFRVLHRPNATIGGPLVRSAIISHLRVF